MKLLILRQTAFGHSIRSGALCIAWCSLVISLLLCAGLLCVLLRITMDPIGQFPDETSLKPVSKDEEITMKCEEAFSMCVLLVLLVCALVTCLFLVIGIYKKRPRFMLPWIWIHAATIAVLFSTCFGQAFFESGIDKYVFRNIVYGFLHLYIFSIVYTHYKSLKPATNGGIVYSERIIDPESICQKEPIKQAGHVMA